jgi:uncharacterized damage-inducible protein DinB
MKSYNDLSHISISTFFEAFEQGTNRIRKAIEGLTESEMKQQIIPNKWSIWEIIFHLTDAEILGASRVRQAFTQSNKPLAYYNPDIWAIEMQYQNANMEVMEHQLQLLELLRITSLRIFKLAKETDWIKTVNHPERGEVTLLNILQLYADHTERHLEQILERRKLLGKPLDIPLLFNDRMY